MAIKLESDYDSSTSSLSDGHSIGKSPVHLTKITKCKVSAMEDHGYIKKDRSVILETDCESDLGVLTPASSPPLPVQTPIKAEPVVHPVRNVHKYLANLSSSQINYPNITVTANSN